jgi:hypothetical protein
VRALIESGTPGYLIEDVYASHARGWSDFVPRDDPAWLEQHLTLEQEFVGIRLFRFGEAAGAPPPAIEIDLRDLGTREQYLRAPIQPDGWSRYIYMVNVYGWAMTTGEAAFLQLLLQPESGYIMRFNVRPFLPVTQHLMVRLNSHTLYSALIPPEPSQVTVEVPAHVVQSGLNTVELEHQPAGAPLEAPHTIGTTGVIAPVDIKLMSLALHRGGWLAIYVAGDAHSYELQGRGYNRGYTVAVLDEEGSVEQLELLDPFASSEASQHMASFISTIPEGRIVIAVTRDEASENLTEDAVHALHSISAAGDLRGRYRWTHAILGVKGAAPGTAMEQMSEDEVSLLVGRDPQEPILLVDRVLVSPVDPSP